MHSLTFDGRVGRRMLNAQRDSEALYLYWVYIWIYLNTVQIVDSAEIHNKFNASTVL